jgi:hypothetical protein
MTSLQNLNVNLNQLGIRQVDETNFHPHKSIWFIVINTNKKADTTSQLNNLKEKFETSIATIFDKENLSASIKVLKKDTVIEDVNITTSIEVGSKFKRVHANIMLEITHNGKIHLDYPQFKRNFSTVMGLPTNLHFNIQHLFDKEILQSYINKGTRRQDLPTQDDVSVITEAPPLPPRPQLARKAGVPKAPPRLTEQQKLVDWFKWRQQLNERLDPRKNVTVTKLRPGKR